MVGHQQHSSSFWNPWKSLVYRFFPRFSNSDIFFKPECWVSIKAGVSTGLGILVLGILVLALAGCNGEENGGAGGKIGRFTTPTRSTSIALTSDDRWLVVANRETNSVSVIEVRDARGQDVANKLAEITVGIEPRYVALHPDDTEAYVTNSVSGTVSVISLDGADAFTVVAEIPVGIEPRGCAVTPNGTRLYVANHTSGTVSVINTATRAVIETITLPLGGNPTVNPTAIAITNDEDSDDTDEQVFVTQFFAELIPGGPGEGFDDGKRGIMHTFAVANPSVVTRIILSPLADSGFTANRASFCTQFNQNAPNNTFCPDTAAIDPNDPVIAADSQGVFPNQFFSALIRGDTLYLPNIGAQPEPPVVFNVNVQALVHVVDIDQLAEDPARHVNLNNQIKTETQPTNPTTSLDRLFANNIVAIDANEDGTDFLIVSSGGNYVIRASLDANNILDIGAPDNVVRFQTGNIPNGVVMSSDGRRAYTNNEVNVSVTAIDLVNNTVLTRDIDSGTPPEPGTFAHAVLVGKLAFFTALGIPDNDIFGTPIRAFNPLADRGKASDNGWSSCVSCHPDGLTDNVTWSFATGPRQTIALDAFFGKDNPVDQRISNWSAIRSSITDFNENSINVQGGRGFAGTPPNPNIYNHGVSQGASDALDAQTLWVQTVRTLRQPLPGDLVAFGRGSTIFENNCASCHGGRKWTKSQIVYLDNPAFDANPLGTPAGVPRDPGVISPAGGQIQAYTDQNAATGDPVTITFLDNVGTFNAADAIEIRSNGNPPLGGLGFNVPSFLGIAFTAPYLHQGRAQTLPEVFTQHNLGAGTIATTLTTQGQQDLIVFLNAIDGRTDPFRSETDDFMDAVGR
jgi:YVTN family beta-propeller protein